MNDLNILIVGVGGQGTLLASRILGSVANLTGKDVKVSEVHGMSQRGGSVITYVKMGEKVASPIIEKGEADIILAFELLEGYRWVDYLSPTGVMLVNDQKIDPMPVITGSEDYPENILQKLDEKVNKIISANALEIASECGNMKAVNVVLIGMLAARTGIPKEIWKQALKETVPGKALEVNEKAFEKGYNEYAQKVLD